MDQVVGEANDDRKTRPSPLLLQRFIHEMQSLHLPAIRMDEFIVLVLYYILHVRVGVCVTGSVLREERVSRSLSLCVIATVCVCDDGGISFLVSRKIILIRQMMPHFPVLRTPKARQIPPFYPESRVRTQEVCQRIRIMETDEREAV